MKIECYTSVSDLGLARWQSFLGSDTPFTRYAFHQALEISQSVGDGSGWHPLHLHISNDNDPIALIPGYIKTHSWGEYVFDFAWAQAHEQYQRPYYPKLIAAAPFTPCAGPRILLQPNASFAEVISVLQQALPKLAEQLGFHSWHWLFAQAADWPSAATQWHPRNGCQFHWYNQNYASFDDFLNQLTARKRKTLRKERRKLDQQNIHFQWLKADAIDTLELNNFYNCYANTYHVRGRTPYLNIEFFEQMLRTMPEQILLVKAVQGISEPEPEPEPEPKPESRSEKQRDDASTPLAYAWNFVHGDTLYGRYWGCLEEVPLLHFETCYYQGMDYCIANELQHFDAGAQGEHKLPRGFVPIQTRSYHWLQESGFNDAIAQFCQQEAKHISTYIEWTKAQSPYRAAD